MDYEGVHYVQTIQDEVQCQSTALLNMAMNNEFHENTGLA